MFKISEDANSIFFSFSSEMMIVDRVIQSCRDYLKRFDIPEFSKFRLVLRELLINAVEHGNRKAVERTVSCRIEAMGGFQFKITVEDEGEGFDYASLSMELPKDPHQIRSRGYALIAAFTDKLEFNEKGNKITAFIHIHRETDYRIESCNDWQIITPSGDITAGTADKFRASLVSLIDRGHINYQFDFTHVQDIDSIGLSVMIIFAKMLAKKNAGRQLKIIHAGNVLTDLFHLTRMDKIYKIEG